MLRTMVDYYKMTGMEKSQKNNEIFFCEKVINEKQIQLLVVYVQRGNERNYLFNSLFFFAAGAATQIMTNIVEMITRTLSSTINDLCTK